MSVPGIRRFFRIAGSKRSVERDVDEELRFHLDMRAEELVRRGLSPDHARAGAAQGSGPFYTIVGVVGNVPIGQLDETPTPTIYFPHRQWGDNGMFIVARTAGNPANVASAVRRVVRGLDPDLPVAMVSTMDRNIANS